MLKRLKSLFSRKPFAEPWQDAGGAPSGVPSGVPSTPSGTKDVPDPDADVSIFAVGQVITINGLPFRVARFGERELHLRLAGRGKLTWKKRPARRARTKARRK